MLLENCEEDERKHKSDSGSNIYQTHLSQSKMNRTAHWVRTKQRDHHKSQLKDGTENTFRVNRLWTINSEKIVPVSFWKAVQFVRQDNWMETRKTDVTHKLSSDLKECIEWLDGLHIGRSSGRFRWSIDGSHAHRTLIQPPMLFVSHDRLCIYWNLLTSSIVARQSRKSMLQMFHSTLNNYLRMGNKIKLCNN